MEKRLLTFQQWYEKAAKPFEWKFTRQDLDRFMEKLVPKIEFKASCA
jgi:hypothetical protein